MQGICVLGATGSIGESTLDVLARHPEQYRVVALTANKRIKQLIDLACIHKPDYLVVADHNDFALASELAREAGVNATVLAGEEALCEVAALPQVDSVMAAIVGAAGLMPTLAAVRAGKRVLLANKESLVMSGELFIQAVNDSGATLLPIDSEHNAIFQCLPIDYQYGNLAASGIEKILLTGSGGPFLNLPLDQFDNITPAQACAHPNWDMGQKISVDSATMMNKGLEFIEAKWLFGLQCEDIQVVLHPQSVIHSMVQYRDGSVIAQMGNPDMRTPIAHSLAFPKRIEAGVKPLDFSSLCDFSFTTPDYQRYPNLKLAIEACALGQYATTSLNAANEVAVNAFLKNELSYVNIAHVNESILSGAQSVSVNAIDDVLALDDEARSKAREMVKRLAL